MIVTLEKPQKLILCQNSSIVARLLLTLSTVNQAPAARGGMRRINSGQKDPVIKIPDALEALLRLNEEISLGNDAFGRW